MSIVKIIEHEIQSIQEQISDHEQDKSSCVGQDCNSCERIELKLCDLREDLQWLKRNFNGYKDIKSWQQQEKNPPLKPFPEDGH